MRALWPSGALLRAAAREFRTGRIRLEHLLWAATTNIAALYVFGMIPLLGVGKSFLAYARSLEFYDATLLWQWLRFLGDILFALAALMTAWDFIVKFRPLFPRLAERFPAAGPARQPL